MRLLHLVYFAVASLAMAAFNAVALAIDRTLGLLAEVFTPSGNPMRLWDAEPALAMPPGMSPVDPALQQSLRHEANVSRRAADRHT